MPHRPRGHVIKGLARSRLDAAVSAVGWTSEHLSKDYGEDVLVRIFEGGKATPWSFFVQSKATDHIEEMFSADRRHVAFKITIEHAKHWNQFWEPVVLAVYDAATKETYWEVIQTVFEKNGDCLDQSGRSS